MFRCRCRPGRVSPFQTLIFKFSFGEVRNGRALRGKFQRFHVARNKYALEEREGPSVARKEERKERGLRFIFTARYFVLDSEHRSRICKGLDGSCSSAVSALIRVQKFKLRPFETGDHLQFAKLSGYLRRWILKQRVYNGAPTKVFP